MNVGIRLLLQGLSHQKFIVAGLVAAGEQAGAIVSLDEKARGFARIRNRLRSGLPSPGSLRC